ncbi:MAG: (d)CMP kinase [Thermoanaerobaculia bacterium]
MAEARRAPLIVAIDGPSGVGKSSAARLLARRLGLPFLSTGAMYRAAGLAALEGGVDVEDAAAVARLVDGLRLELVLEESGDLAVRLDGRDPRDRLRGPAVSDITSRLSIYPELRRALVERQRQAAAVRGAVVEGRDVGTVVFPETPFKFFLDADPAVRAERRWRQLQGDGEAAPALAEVEAAERDRDRRDVTREASPLRADASYVCFDTGHLGLEEVVERMAALVSGGAGRPDAAARAGEQRGSG